MRAQEDAGGPDPDQTDQTQPDEAVKFARRRPPSVTRGSLQSAGIQNKHVNADDRAYLERILSCEGQLDRWRMRVQQVEQPERGSDLASDDRAFPFHRVSEIARASLAISGENLRMAVDAIRRQNLYPSAHFTSLRSALVGACQAVWILAPSDGPTRTDRGLCVADEMYAQSAKYHRATTKLAPDLTEADRAALVDQLIWISGRRQQLAIARISHSMLNLTDDVIPSAASIVYPDPRRRAEVSLLWRQMGGDAHVLGWSMFMRSQLGSTDRVSGLAELAAGGSPKAIAQPFVASYEILRTGWSLYDRRCEGHEY